MPGSRATRKVLIVEDNVLQREGLARLLVREGFNVAVAANGQEALNQLHGGLTPDLILLDMLLPVVDGWQVLDRLVEEQIVSRIPIIIATGTVLSREWALDHGCVGFVRKPIEMESLLQEIQRVC